MKNKILLISLLLISILCVGCQEDDIKLSEAHYEGVSFLESGEYELAIEQFQLSLKDSSDESTLLNISKAYYALEQYEESKVYILQSINNTSTDISEEHRVYGDVLYKLSDNELALEQFKIATKLDETNSYAWYGLGLYYESIEDYDQYIEAIVKAAHYSKDKKFDIYLMNAYITINDQSSYREVIKNLYTEYPDDFEIAKYYGQFLDSQYKEDEALEHFKMMATKFDHPGAIILVPEYLFKLNRYSECIDWMTLNAPYTQGPDFIELYANAYFASNQSTKAYEIADHLILENNNNHLGYLLKGKFLSFELNYTEAIIQLKKAIELEDDYKTNEYLLIALFNSNQTKEFQNLAHEIENKFGENPIVKEYLVKSYNLLGEYDKAISILIELSNDNDHLIVNKAQLHYKLKEYETALAYIKAAIEFAPDDNTVEEYRLFSDILSSLGKYDDVIKACILLSDKLVQDNEIEKAINEYLELSDNFFYIGEVGHAITTITLADDLSQSEIISSHILSLDIIKENTIYVFNSRVDSQETLNKINLWIQKNPEAKWHHVIKTTILK